MAFCSGKGGFLGLSHSKLHKEEGQRFWVLQGVLLGSDKDASSPPELLVSIRLWSAGVWLPLIARRGGGRMLQARGRRAAHVGPAWGRGRAACKDDRSGMMRCRSEERAAEKKGKKEIRERRERKEEGGRREVGRGPGLRK